MGIHICFMRENEDHPDWDYLRETNDSDFPELIDYDTIISNPDDNEFWRPTDLENLRNRVKATGWHNTGRYLHLINLIENNPDYWVCFSW